MSDNPKIEFALPELRRWENGGVAPYVHVRDSGVAGSTVMVNALTHGNELSGAVVLDELLSLNFRPRKGMVILSFGNIDAYLRFDPATPLASRMVDEDFNRVWGRLHAPPTTSEARRALALKPFVDQVDYLLDLHSMHDDGVPLMLAGPLAKGMAFAQQLGIPADIVRDAGHAAGVRLRDYGGFGEATSTKNALLLEAGEHGRASSVTVARSVTARFLIETGVALPEDLPNYWLPSAGGAQRVVEVTHVVTTPRGRFTPVRHFEGQEVIPSAGTLLGYDEGVPIATPYDECVLVMPVWRRKPRPGETVLRLARRSA